MATARKPIDIITAHYSAAKRHDLAGMLSDLSPDVEWTEMAGFPYVGTYVGRDAIVSNVFASIARDWQKFDFQLERLIDGGDSVVAVGNYVASHRATGKSMNVRAIHLWQVKDDRIHRFEQFSDTQLIHLASMPT